MNSSDFQNPIDYLSRARKEKYKWLLIPIFVIMINFILKQIWNIPYIEYASAFFFIVYMIISYIFRIEKPAIEINESNLLAPVTGKIISINKEENCYCLTIEKALLSGCEIRTMTNTDLINTDDKNELSWTIPQNKVRIFTQRNPHPQGQLIGIVPGKCDLLINIPQDYELSIIPGQKIQSGATILATSKRSSLIGNEGRENE